MRRLLPVLLPFLAFTLACGGLWREVLEEDLAELAVQVQQTARGPERDATLAEVRRAFVAVRTGHVGGFGLLGFEIEVEDAAADGAITAGELAGIRRKAPTLPSHPDQVRYEALKHEFDLLVEDAGGIPPADASWSPGRLQAALEAAGWSGAGCQEAGVAGRQGVRCDASRGDDALIVQAVALAAPAAAAAEAERHPEAEVRVRESSVLRVRVIDGEASEALRDTLLPPGERIADLDRQRLAERAAAAGWIPVQPSDDRRARDAPADWHLALSAQGRWAVVDVEVAPDAGEAEHRSEHTPRASVTQGQPMLVVTAYDRSAAAAVLDAVP